MSALCLGGMCWCPFCEVAGGTLCFCMLVGGVVTWFLVRVYVVVLLLVVGGVFGWCWGLVVGGVGVVPVVRGTH